MRCGFCCSPVPGDSLATRLSTGTRMEAFMICVCVHAGVLVCLLVSDVYLFWGSLRVLCASVYVCVYSRVCFIVWVSVCMFLEGVCAVCVSD